MTTLFQRFDIFFVVMKYDERGVVYYSADEPQPFSKAEFKYMWTDEIFYEECPEDFYTQGKNHQVRNYGKSKIYERTDYKLCWKVRVKTVEDLMDIRSERDFHIGEIKSDNRFIPVLVLKHL